MFVVSNCSFCQQSKWYSAMRTRFWYKVCIWRRLSSWLETKSLTVSTFYSAQALRGLLLTGCLSTVPVSRNFFDRLLTPRFVQVFSENSSIDLFAVYFFKCKLFIKILSLLLNTAVTSAVMNFRCHKLIASKCVKEQWYGKFCLQSVWERLAILNTEYIKICGWVAKLEAIKMHFFHICWISAENLNF